MKSRVVGNFKLPENHRDGITISYDLEGSEEKLLRMVNVDAMYAAVENFDQWLRNKIKYQDAAHLESVRDKLYDCLGQYRLELYNDD